MTNLDWIAIAIIGVLLWNFPNLLRMSNRAESNYAESREAIEAPFRAHGVVP